MRTHFERYVLKETLLAFLGVSLVLFLILVANQFAHILGDAATGELPRRAIFPLLGVTSLTNLTALIPAALLLGVMLALGRFYHDSEMAAAQSCGLGPDTLVRPVLFFAGVISVLLAVLTLAVTPRATRGVQELRNEAKSDFTVSQLVPGRFLSANGGDIVVYAAGVERDGRLNNVFLQHRAGDALQVVLAEHGAETATDKEGNSTLILQDGVRYAGVVGDASFDQMVFREHGIPLIRPDAVAAQVNAEAQSTWQLMQARTPVAFAQLQWRLSIPFMSMVLAFAAITLSRARPRQGRYSRIIFGLIAFVVYANLLTVSRGAIAQSKIPAWIGLWWVHLLFIALAWYWYRTARGPQVKNFTSVRS